MSFSKYDCTGKVELHKIYNKDVPTSYFYTLSKLDYIIPRAAKPIFNRIIAARRRETGRRRLKIVDIGCSYGVNAALLKHGLSMETLYRLYGERPAMDRAGLLKRDRAVFAEPADDDLEFVGIDQARNAVAYALDAGALDVGIATDLEKHEPNAADRTAIRGADLIISTGCFGYVTETSLERLLDATRDSRPWMVHFVLRMFSFNDAEAMLERRGYVTEEGSGVFPQRRFASQEECENTLQNLAAQGIDPEGVEETGWYFAKLYVARPADDARKLPLVRLMAEAVPEQ